MPVTVRIGKEGLSESAINECKIQMKRHGTIRVQMTRGIAEGAAKRKMKADLVEALNAKVVRAVGFVVVLEARRR